jgi:hypothetical protein
MTGGRVWMPGAPAVMALAQMTAPAPIGATFMLVPICGEYNGHAVPIRLPGKDDGPGGAPCCKICHSAMRKRIGGDTCCDGEDEADAA